MNNDLILFKIGEIRRQLDDMTVMLATPEEDKESWIRTTQEWAACAARMEARRECSPPPLDVAPSREQRTKYMNALNASTHRSDE
jgi:hypothetical protein